MTNYVVPSVGTSGLFELKAPFETLMLANNQYTCKSVRTLSEMIANNEDPLALIYRPVELTEDEFKADLALDMRILSLQAGIGHWVHVPVSYVTRYPDTNGVPYRSVGIAIQLPPIEASRDLGALVEELNLVIRGYIGTDAKVRVADTSYTALVPDDKHQVIQTTRKANAVLQGSTTWHRLRTLQAVHDATVARLQALEDYVKTLT